MIRRSLRVLLFCLTLLVITGQGLAQTAQPSITSFSATATNVSLGALQSRTARIPVAWTTVNRPLLATLIFDQLLPDGSIVNVELPRVFAWVNSNDSGTAAPIMPGGIGVTTITLRLSLVNIVTQQIYDQKTLTLPIVPGGAGPGTSKPAITAFDTTTGTVSRRELEAGTARIPVSWTAINRPITATLIFEQVLSDGRIVNVELPRESPWVNSRDRGVVKPVIPGGTSQLIRLRVRLYDLLFNRNYDIRELYVPIETDAVPVIDTFTTTSGGVERGSLPSRSAYLDVQWKVSNRPGDTNLVFDQVMPGGELRNVELPRDFVLVPSSGNGWVRPYDPGSTVTELRFVLRLIRANGTVLTTKELVLPIIEPATGWIEVEARDCYRPSFPPSNGLQVSGEGRVEQHSGVNGVSIYAEPDFTGYLGELPAGSTFTVMQGPICRYDALDPSATQRVWRVRGVEGREGWALEYFPGERFVRVLNSTQNDPIPTVRINSFTITPESGGYGDTVTLSWEIVNAIAMTLQVQSTAYDQTTLDYVDSLTLPVSELMAGSLNPTTIRLYGYDVQQNVAQAEVTFTVDTTAQINSFTVTPEDPPINGSVTLTWDYEGVQNAQLLWNRNYYEVPVLLADVTSQTGSYTAPLSGQYRAHTFTLLLMDANDVPVMRDVTVMPSCPYTYFVSDPNFQQATCPTNLVASVNAAYQPFQNGFMLWRQGTSFSGGNEVVVFAGGGSRVMRFDDTWNGQAFEILDTPPDGLLKPERGFGFIWSQNPDVREALGWATAAEQGYSASYQVAGAMCGRAGMVKGSYTSLPDGRTVRQGLCQSGWVLVP
jgi:hypothetical protein